MQNWTTPQLQELDVCLTAKDPGHFEAESTVVDGYILPATFSVYEETPNPYPCLPPKEAPQS